MPKELLDISVVTALAGPVKSTAKFSHKIKLCKLPGDERIFIAKEMESPFVAKLELLAQEFFRLIIPHQPETRIALDPKTGVHYILSEMVPGYHELPTNEADKFADGTYTGLGQVALVSMFLEEIDLKNGNVGLDDKGRVIKIDGDWCFAAIRDYGGDYRMTPASIEQLPYPKDFYAFNWLELFKRGIAQPVATVVNPTLSVAPQFRSELNQAMLKICLLPDSFIDKLVDAYMPAGGERFVKLLKDRRDELRLSAIQNPSFLAYLETPHAEEDMNNLIAQINAFRANGEQLIPVDAQAGLKDEIQANRGLCTNLASQCSLFLATIEKLQVNSADHLLIDYVKVSRERLESNKANPAELLVLKAELSATYASVSSNEVVDVKTAITKMRGGSSTHRSSVADTIEEGLITIPIAERGTVCTQKGAPNQVQLALGSYRYAVCIYLLDEIDACSVSQGDYLLMEYVRVNRERIDANKTNPTVLLAIQKGLSAIRDSVNSREVKEIKTAIATLRYESHSETNLGHWEKANRIEAALNNTPLEQRGTVFTQAGDPNPVQIALASHRFGRNKGLYHYKDVDGHRKIDEEHVGDIYKNLRKLFAEAAGRPTTDTTAVAASAGSSASTERSTSAASENSQAGAGSGSGASGSSAGGAGEKPTDGHAPK